VSSFDDMVVWGHDRVPDSDDTFVKGIEEWISFAEAIHGKPGQQAKQTE
jgi:ribonuclease H2 subunit C